MARKYIIRKYSNTIGSREELEKWMSLARAVAIYIGEGHTYNEAAEEFCVSRGTIETMMRKLRQSYNLTNYKCYCKGATFEQQEKIAEARKIAQYLLTGKNTKTDAMKKFGHTRTTINKRLDLLKNSSLEKDQKLFQVMEIAVQKAQEYKVQMRK